jgi:putative copper resistance protein D
MEHSLLHALLLSGLIVAFGGPFAVLWLIRPATRISGAVELGRTLTENAARWTAFGALAAAFATCVDFIVQVAEIRGQTVFAGADLAVVVRFATQTHVGRLALARLGLLLLTACAARLGGKRNWWLVAVLASAAIVVTSLVSHAAAQPENRVVAIASQIAHITAAAAWMGVLLHLFIARSKWTDGKDENGIGLVAEIVRRFSPVALTATSLLGLTGVIAAYRYLNTPSALFFSAYGLTLVVKLVLLTPAIAAGFANFRHVGPKLAAVAKTGVGARAALHWFSRTLELEITAGVLVITVAGILGSVSPPGDDGSLRLTPVQTAALLSPHWPTTDISSWDTPDDPRGPTIGDLRYSEVTHNWSGVTVCLLGLAWLVQMVGGRAGIWAARLSPFLLVPFGCFIAVAANPELWLLHTVSPWRALTDPILLEHQTGALMVFLIAWLTWRDRKKPVAMRPLGYALPVIMVVGSLLLLGHAHSTLTITDELTNLINVQHAVFGAFGLFGGTLRWLMLRGLLPGRFAKFLWPCCVIGLGLFMAFFYREVV